jgi:integrase
MDAVLCKKKNGKMVPRGGNAANKDRKTLCAAWKWGATFIPGFPVGVNPWLVAPRMPEERSPRYVPPASDFWRVIDYLKASDDISDKQDVVMLMAMLHTAGRRNEIFNLKVFDIDESRIRLWTRKRDGGNLEANWIPLTPKLKTILADWIKARPVKAENVFVILKNTPGNERFYGQPFTNRQHFMRRVCKRAGVKPFGFHAIRHLSASVLWNEGVDIKDVQLILRHMSQATTERYLHRLGLLQPTGERIGQALERGGKVIQLTTAKVAEG